MMPIQAEHDELHKRVTNFKHPMDLIIHRMFFL
jgi:hypothetical protein